MKNPLLLKEFRQRMRTARAPIVVAGYLISMVLLTFVLLYENVQGQLYMFQPARSQQVFFILSLLQMTIVGFLTPAFSAGAISGERERRTLAILLTTPLSPFEILIGKILSSSALLSLLLFVTLPLYSLVFLFGGAVPAEALIVFAFQLFTIVIIATISVMWSTLALRSGWSMVLSYGTVSFMMIITGVVGYGLSFVHQQNPMESNMLYYAHIFLSLNPLWVEACLENVVSEPVHAWISFVLFYGLLAAILMVVSIWRLRPQLLHKLPFATRINEKNYQ